MCKFQLFIDPNVYKMNSDMMEPSTQWVIVLIKVYVHPITKHTIYSE